MIQRRSNLVRQSYQRGFVRLRGRKRACKGVKGKEKGEWIAYYRVRNGKSSTGWSQKSEPLPECRTEAEAKETLAKRMIEINRYNRVGSHAALAVTFGDFASGLWQSYLKKREIKPSTAYSFQSMLNNFALPSLGKTLVDQIRPQQITDLLDRLARDGKSEKYLMNFYSMLRTMFEVASDYGLIAQSPIKRKLHRPRWRRSEKPALSAEQIRTVLQKVPDDYRLLF